jgi:hypothetical protein
VCGLAVAQWTERPSADGEDVGSSPTGDLRGAAAAVGAASFTPVRAAE